MKSLIKQLQDGEIAVKNDGSIEDLRRVLKAAFPNDIWMAEGDCEYYYANKNKPTEWKVGRDYLPAHSTSKFIKELDNMEKTRTITPEQAQSIIDIACSTWKGSLSEEWATDIVLKQDITISEEMYKRMRNACTGKQHRLFDEIFGKDEPEYKVGDYLVFHNTGGRIKGEIPCNIPLKVISLSAPFNSEDICDATLENGAKVRLIDPLNPEFHYLRYFRKATEEEIQKAQYYPDGTPCLVRDAEAYGWTLRYADGKGRFYESGKKSGATSPWNYHMKLDMNNLPVNE